MNKIFHYCAVLLVNLFLANSFLLPHNAHSSLASLPQSAHRHGNSGLPGCLTLRHCIHKLKNLHNYSSPAVTLMAEPLTKDQILRVLPEEVTSHPHVANLVQLFTITNGVNYTDEEVELQQLWLFPHFFLLSLDEATELYLNFPRGNGSIETITDSTAKSANAQQSQHSNDFDLTWFPLMASGMGDYIFLNLSSGVVFEYSPFEVHYHKNQYIQEDNMFELFKKVVKEFEKGNFIVSSGKTLVSDESREETEEQLQGQNNFALEHNIENIVDQDEEISLQTRHEQHSDEEISAPSRHNKNLDKAFENERRVLYRERAVLNAERRVLNDERRILNRERIILNQERRLMNHERLSHLEAMSSIRSRRRRNLPTKKAVNTGEIHMKTSQPHRKKITFKLGTPLLYLQCQHIRMVCDNIRVSIKASNKPRRLCLLSERQAIFKHARTICGVTKRSRGFECNAYPLLTTQNADQGSPMIVPTTENNVFGMQLHTFYHLSGMDNGVNRHKCFKLVHP